MGSGKAGGGEHGSAQSEGESEDRVLPLDHFEGYAEVVENGHRKIVEHQNLVLWASGFGLGGGFKFLPFSVRAGWFMRN